MHQRSNIEALINTYDHEYKEKINIEKWTQIIFFNIF